MAFNIPAGKLKHIVTIRSKSLVADAGHGGSSEVWSDYKAGVRVEKKPMAGVEKVIKQAEITEELVRYRGRYIAGVNATMRVLDGGTEYKINSVIDISSDGRWMEIMAKAIKGA